MEQNTWIRGEAGYLASWTWARLLFVQVHTKSENITCCSHLWLDIHHALQRFRPATTSIGTTHFLEFDHLHASRVQSRCEAVLVNMAMYRQARSQYRSSPVWLMEYYWFEAKPNIFFSNASFWSRNRCAMIALRMKFNQRYGVKKATSADVTLRKEPRMVDSVFGTTSRIHYSIITAPINSNAFEYR